MKNASTVFHPGDPRPGRSRCSGRADLRSRSPRLPPGHAAGTARRQPELHQEERAMVSPPCQLPPVSGPHRGPDAAPSRRARADRCRSGHGSRCPCFTDAGRPCGCQNPMLANTMQGPPGSRHATRPESAQASRDCTHGRASIAFVYTRPLAWATPWNPMPYGESAVPHRDSRSRRIRRTVRRVFV